VELLFHSYRAAGISFAEASHFSLPVKGLLELIFPYFFHLTEFPWVSLGWAKFPYLGIVPFVLALFGIIFADRKYKWWLVLVVIFVIFVILGSNAFLPVYFFLYRFVPGFNLFRYPIKFLFVLVFIFSFLTGLGMDVLKSIINKGPKDQPTSRVLISLAILLFLLFICYLWLQQHPQTFYEALKPLFSEELKQSSDGFIKKVVVPRNIANFGIMTGLLAILWLWFAFAYYRKISERVFMAGIAFLVFIDLYTANANANFSVASKIYRETIPKNVKILQADKDVFRYFVAPELYRRAHYDLNRDFYDYQKALYFVRERLTANQGMLFGLCDVGGYESIRGADGEKLLRRIWELNSLEGIRILDLINVKYLITPWVFKQKGYELVRVTDDPLRDGKIFLYRNHHYLPRTFFVPRAKVIFDRNKILDYLFTPQFNPTQEVILEEKVDNPAGFVFTSEWFYPGWRAYVDGKETKIYRANYMFRAVPVPANKSKVKFVYDPLLFKVGAVISSVTILLLLASIILSRRLR
ncbi:MAG: YfhO family protein, partial [Candidatus Margulisiibacteriota bacterium]